MSSNTKSAQASQPGDIFETIWKTLNCVLLFMLLFCISSFLSFRGLAQDNGYDFVHA